MDCATVHWVARAGCHLNNTYLDELAAMVFLILVCVVVLFMLGMSFIDGVIKPWRKGKANPAAPPDADATNTEQV